MKIVYFGTDAYLPCFRYLVEREEILALYTYHNDEDYFSEFAIVREAAARGIPVVYGRIGEERVREFFEKEGCELFFAAEYGYIIPVPEGLSSFRGLNMHGSFLPEGRGYYPIECAMSCNRKQAGVTMHQMEAAVDTGDVIFQDRIEILPEMDSIDVYLESSRRALEMTQRLFADFDRQWNGATPQKGEGEWLKKPAEKLRLIGHGMTVAQAMDVHRRYNQMTMVRVNGRLCHVVSVECGVAPLAIPEVEIAPNRFLFGVADGHLRLAVFPTGGSK